MSVKLAVQLFSDFMWATIRTCIQRGQLQNNTTDFFEFINHLFDYVNSRSLYNNNLNHCALIDSVL